MRASNRLPGRDFQAGIRPVAIVPPAIMTPGMHWLLSLIVTASLLLLIAHLVRGFELDGFGAALLAAIVIGFVNATLGLVLRILAFPLTLLTFGVFLLVINAIMLKLAAALVPGFRIRGCWPALLAAVLLSVVNFLLGR